MNLRPLVLALLASAGAIVPTYAVAQPAGAVTKPAAGPTIDSAPEDATPKAEPSNKTPLGLGSGPASDAELVRGLTERRFRAAEESASTTSVGGYGEAQVRGLKQGLNGERQW